MGSLLFFIFYGPLRDQDSSATAQPALRNRPAYGCPLGALSLGRGIAVEEIKILIYEGLSLVRRKIESKNIFLLKGQAP